METLFTTKENIGRNKFVEFSKTINSIDNIKFTENKYDHFDTYFKYYGIDCIGEIKLRSCNSHSFKGLFILEKYKYDSLKKIISSDKANELKTQIYYINLFQDNKMVMWNLTDINPKWVNDPYNKTTCGNREEVIKEVTYLNINSGIIYELNNNN